MSASRSVSARVLAGVPSGRRFLLRCQGSDGTLTTMGISGLLPALSKCTRRVNVSSYSGKKVLVDASCWLHKAAFSCAQEICEGRHTDRFVNFCMSRIKMMRHHRVEPILVFDGMSLPSKTETNAARRRQREAALARARELVRDKRMSEAHEWYQKAVTITTEMRSLLIVNLRKQGVKYFVAPFEADAQLAILCRQYGNDVGAVITEDSDLLLYPYCCHTILYKMDKNGNGDELDVPTLFEDVEWNPIDNCSLYSKTTHPESPFAHLSWPEFTMLCILSGCDYVGSLQGIGLKTLIKLFSKCGIGGTTSRWARSSSRAAVRGGRVASKVRVIMCVSCAKKKGLGASVVPANGAEKDDFSQYQCARNQSGSQPVHANTVRPVWTVTHCECTQERAGTSASNCDCHGISCFGCASRVGQQDTVEVVERMKWNNVCFVDGLLRAAVEALHRVQHALQRFFRPDTIPGVPDFESYLGRVIGALLTFLFHWIWDPAHREMRYACEVMASGKTALGKHGGSSGVSGLEHVIYTSTGWSMTALERVSIGSLPDNTRSRPEDVGVHEAFVRGLVDPSTLKRIPLDSFGVSRQRELTNRGPHADSRRQVIRPGAHSSTSHGTDRTPGRERAIGKKPIVGLISNMLRKYQAPAAQRPVSGSSRESAAADVRTDCDEKGEESKHSKTRVLTQSAFMYRIERKHGNVTQQKRTGPETEQPTDRHGKKRSLDKCVTYAEWERKHP